MQRESFDVVGLDTNMSVICHPHDGSDDYNSGESLEDFGIDFLTITEADALIEQLERDIPHDELPLIYDELVAHRNCLFRLTPSRKP